MTEKEFLSEVWRAHDIVLTSEGIKARVQNVCFTTRSVRIKMPGDGLPEWIRCELIEAHTTQKGDACDPATIIEELHYKLLAAQETIEKKTEKIKELEEKVNKNHLKDLLCALNLMKQGLQEKKHKMAQIENGLQMIDDVIAKLNGGEKDE